MRRPPRVLPAILISCCAALRLAPLAPTRLGHVTACAPAAADALPLVNISWREESIRAETVVPSVSLTRSRDGSTGTATFNFERPRVVHMNDVWDNGLITGLWLHDEEGPIHSEDLKLKFVEGRPVELEAVLVLKSIPEWERFMRFMRRYAAANNLAFEKAETAAEEEDG